jgi:hypothetical protein
MSLRFSSLLLAVAINAAPFACGGSTESSSPSSGGSTQDASVAGQGGGAQGGNAQGGAAGQGGSAQGGNAQGGEAGQGGSAQGGAAGSGVDYPPCAERGGDCVLLQALSDPCPAGTYNPFSGSMDKCPTSTIRRCCVSMGELGSTCDLTHLCSNGGCLPEQSGYPPGGYCTSVCDPDASQCPSWATCLTVMWSQAIGNCMVKCDSNAKCREGWTCEALRRHPFSDTDLTTTYVCWQGGQLGKGLGTQCSQDGDCLSQMCRPDSSQQNRCSAMCDTANPCLAGYTCKTLSSCTTPGCGYCAPG